MSELVANESGVPINPATEEKQDDIITALGGGGGGGSATAVNQALEIAELEDINANTVTNATEAKQDNTITELGDKLDESTFTGSVGEVQDTPTQYTLLRRVKDLLSLIVLAAGNAVIGKMKLVDDSENVIGSTNNALDVNNTNGVPNTFTKSMKSSRSYSIVKGQLNKMRIRPAILNEHAESSREVMATVTSSNIVGQMFQPSQDNINGLLSTLQSAATFASVDSITVDTGSSEQKGGTMEYSSSAELQEEWIESNTAAARAAYTDSGGTTQDGNYCMQMALTDPVNAEWRLTVTSTDLTGVTFSLKYAQNKTFGQAKMFFFISDGTNGKSFLLPVGAASVWQTFAFSETDMSVDGDDDGAGVIDVTAITKMGFRIDDRQGGGALAYADSITYQAAGGSFDVKLWDCGAVLPVADGATFDLTNNATQYAEIGDRGIAGVVVAARRVDLKGGKRLYHIEDFIAGTALEHPDNNILTVDNYYAITFHYVDTNIDIYGPDTTFSVDYYTNGYAFQTSAENVDITKISGAAGAGAYSDLMFGVFSDQDAWYTGYHLHFMDISGNPTSPGIFAEWLTILEDASMVFTHMMTHHGGHPVTDGNYVELFDKPALLPKGGKFEIYYNDDPQDDVTFIVLEAFQIYIPPTING